MIKIKSFFSKLWISIKKLNWKKLLFFIIVVLLLLPFVPLLVHIWLDAFERLHAYLFDIYSSFTLF